MGFYLLQIVYDETYVRSILCEHKDITQISPSIQEYYESLLKEIEPLWENEDLDYDETMKESIAQILSKLHHDGFKIHPFKSSVLDICNQEVIN